jgi:hypothetical protein
MLLKRSISGKPVNMIIFVFFQNNLNEMIDYLNFILNMNLNAKEEAILNWSWLRKLNKITSITSSRYSIFLEIEK